MLNFYQSAMECDLVQRLNMITLINIGRARSIKDLDVLYPDKMWRLGSERVIHLNIKLSVVPLGIILCERAVTPKSSI